MSGCTRHDRVVPRGGPVLAAAVTLIALVPLSVAGPDGAAGASSSGVTFHSVATLTGPVTVGHIVEPLSAHPLELAASGYEEHEYFASGTAMAFEADATPSDGKWTVSPTSTAVCTRPASSCAGRRTRPVSTGR